MVIEFQCPNGHKLSCPVDRAGRTAKCPRCGSVVQIPQANGQGSGKAALPAAEAASGSDSGRTSGSDAGRVGGSGEVQSGSAVRQGSFVFFCPNGHRLNGPKTLQGRAGKCPHCNVQFRIPGEGEPPQAVAANGTATALGAPAPLGAVGSAATGSDEQQYLDPLQQLFDEREEGVADEESPVDDSEAGDSEAGDLQMPGPEEGGYERFEMPSDAHPMARLFDKLWEEKSHGGIVELHLREGGVLVPDWFERRLSQESHGLFAVQAADGTLTLTAVSWDLVLRVVVRSVVALPEGMFEE